jgi:hypothetical protein
MIDIAALQRTRSRPDRRFAAGKQPEDLTAV